MFVYILERAVRIERLPLIAQILFPIVPKTIEQPITAEDGALDSVKLPEEFTDPILPKQFANHAFGVAPMIIELPGRVIDLSCGDGVDDKVPIAGQAHRFKDAA